jgi:multiple sugar transport system substrate-binding protein
MDEPEPIGRPWRTALARRQFLRLLGAGAGVAVVGCTPAGTTSPAATGVVATNPSTAQPTGAASGEAFDWRQFAGMEITALFTNNPQGLYLEKQAAAFEADTGIKVNVQILDTAGMRDKQNVVFAAGSSEIDVWHSYLNQEGAQYLRAGWYEFPDPYLADPTLTSPDYDLNDLEAALPLSSEKDQLVGMPLWVEVQPLYYNKALLDAAGLSVPTTLDELKDAASKIHAPDRDVYGWTTRATSPLNTSTINPVLFSYGGSWLDDQGKAALNSAEAVKALDWYGSMLRLYGLPSPETVDITRWSDAFKAGKVAFALDSPSFIGPFSDPSSSAIAGKFGVANWPAGPAGSLTTLTNWTLCISKFSEKKDAAWLYCQWHTTKKGALDIAVKTGVMPSRDSVASSPEYQAYLAATLSNLSDIRSYGLAHGVTQVFPPIKAVAPARQIYGDAIVKVIQGGDPKAVADQANAQFQTLLDQEPA